MRPHSDPPRIETSPWWLQSLQACMTSLSSSVKGLTTDEAQKRLKQYGTNVFIDTPQHSLLRQFLKRFTNPLVIILLVASVVSALTGELTSFVLISTMVIMSVLLDFIQEYRAGQAAQRLRATVAIRASVLRDDIQLDIPVSQLAPGDLVLLTAGDMVPADCRVLDSTDFFVNQSLLTGEPYPVENMPVSWLKMQSKSVLPVTRYSWAAVW